MNEYTSIQVKDLAVKIGTLGIEYLISSLVDWVIPNTHLTKSLENDEPKIVERKIELPDGTPLTLKIELGNKLLKKIQKSTPLTLTSKLYTICDDLILGDNEDIKMSISSSDNKSKDKSGGVSILNGIITVNW